jgi:hypothetical protein
MDNRKEAEHISTWALFYLCSGAGSPLQVFAKKTAVTNRSPFVATLSAYQ